MSVSKTITKTMRMNYCRLFSTTKTTTFSNTDNLANYLQNRVTSSSPTSMRNFVMVGVKPKNQNFNIHIEKDTQNLMNLANNLATPNIDTEDFDPLDEEVLILF